MYRISKKYYFSASHQIPGLPADHPCSRIHGHNYTVEVELEAREINEIGFVRDFHDLRRLKEYIDCEIDHRHLNDVLGDKVVTSEQLAKYFFDWCRNIWQEVSAVRISETSQTWAEYRRYGSYEADEKNAH